MFCFSTSIDGIMGATSYMTLSKATFGVFITSIGLLTCAIIAKLLNWNFFSSHQQGLIFPYFGPSQFWVKVELVV
jgi:hypothetical protein